MSETTGKKKRRIRLRFRPGAATWLLFLLMSLVFIVFVFRFPLLPKKWKFAILAILILVAAVLAYFSFRRKRKGDKTVISVINTILAICLLFGSMFLPGLAGRIEKVFADFPETEEVVINVYALKTEYKSAHSDQFREKGVSMITDTDLNNYKNKQFITQSAVDQSNQEWVLGQLKELYGTDSLWQNNTSSVGAAVNALYNADGDALILNAAYADLIIEDSEYSNFKEDTVILKSFNRTVDNESAKKKLDSDKPFAVLIAGSDSRDTSLTTVTRTDVDILTVVNPDKKTILLISLPRDTYMANPALNNGLDKLTHMGVYGVNNTVNALGQFFDYELDKYVLVNFNTYSRIVNTLGGVNIVNPYAFSGGGYSFQAGNIHLSGEEALAYVRERKSLPNGDFDRNEHQVIVLRALIKKMLSTDVLTNFAAVLDSLNGTFLTNMSTDSVFELVSSQLDSVGSWTILSRHIDGSTAMAETASMPGQLLSVVYPDENIVSSVREEMVKLLEE